MHLFYIRFLLSNVFSTLSLFSHPLIHSDELRLVWSSRCLVRAWGRDCIWSTCSWAAL